MRALKRTTSLMLAAVLLASMLFSLTSCNTRLKGEYSMKQTYYTETYIFDGKNVTMCTEYSSTISLPSVDISGKYDIDYKGAKEGYEIEFVWDAEGSYANKSEEERTEVYTFKKTNTYIQIGDKYYTKQSTESHEGHNHG